LQNSLLNLSHKANGKYDSTVVSYSTPEWNSTREN